MANFSTRVPPPFQTASAVSSLLWRRRVQVNTPATGGLASDRVNTHKLDGATDAARHNGVTSLVKAGYCVLISLFR